MYALDTLLVASDKTPVGTKSTQSLLPPREQRGELTSEGPFSATSIACIEGTSSRVNS